MLQKWKRLGFTTFWVYEIENGREKGKSSIRERYWLCGFSESFFFSEFSDVECLAGKVKGIFSIKIHISWKCMILQILSNYIINFEICKIEFSKSYIFRITNPKPNFPKFICIKIYMNISIFVENFIKSKVRQHFILVLVRVWCMCHGNKDQSPFWG